MAAVAESNSALDTRIMGGKGAANVPTAANEEDIGPIQEYDRRVDSGVLRNDEHQRGEQPKIH